MNTCEGIHHIRPRNFTNEPSLLLNKFLCVIILGSGTECVIGKVSAMSGQSGQKMSSVESVVSSVAGGTPRDNDDPEDGGFSNYSSKHQGLQQQQQQQQSYVLQQQQQQQQFSHPQQVQFMV